MNKFIEDDSSLYNAVSRHLHGIGNACKELGISREDMRTVYGLTNNNVVFYNVSHFYPMLEKINRQDLIYKCQGILSEESELQESVTTERSIPSHSSDGKVTV